MSGRQQPAIIGIDASRAARGQRTGTENYSHRIIQELIDQDTSHRFRLYINSKTPISLRRRASIEQRLIPFPRIWTHLRLSTELAFNHVDSLFVPAHVVPLIHPQATIVTVHDLGYLHEPAAHTGSSRWYLHWSTRWSVRAARRIIAISEATKRDLVDRYRVPESRITVIHHGVDERFRPASSDEIGRIHRSLGIDDPFILFVGTIQPRKNIVRLIRAFEVIARERPDIRLVLAGKMGWKTAEIEQPLRESIYAERIQALGHVPDDDLPALYSAATVFALPSLYEGFGMPVLEAMACCTPTLVSNRGSLPEVAGDASLIVDALSIEDIADGLRRLLSDSDRQTRTELGRRHAAGFTWETAGRRTLETIVTCLEERARKHE